MSDCPIERALDAYYAGEYKPTPRELQHAQEVYDADVAEYKEKQLVHEPWANGPRERVWPSDGFACSRKLYYNLKGYAKDQPNRRSRFKMKTGVMLETQIVCDMILAGLPVLYPSPTQYASKSVMGGMPVSGKCDAVIDGIVWGSQFEGKKIPVEVKTTDPYSYGKWAKEGPQNTWGYVDQLAIYVNELEAPFGVFYMADRAIGHSKTFRMFKLSLPTKHIEEAILEASGSSLPARPGWAEPVYKPRVKSLDGQHMGCMELSDKRCSYCPFTKHCFPTFKVEALSSGPKYRDFSTPNNKEK